MKLIQYPKLNDLSSEKSYDRVRFHIQTGDYFAFLNSVLSFVDESLAADTRNQSKLHHIQIEAIRAMRKDLSYLHRNYKIVPKNNKRWVLF